MPWVLDVSITMAWCFEDERTSDTDELAARLKNDAPTVTQLWHLEVANVLTQAARRKKGPRITLAERAQFLDMLGSTTIHVDSHTFENAWSATLDLADTHQLTTYDAAYLELAMRMGAELATLDVELRAAAKVVGITVVPVNLPRAT